MGVELAKDGIDLGITVADSERSLDFYCGLLGFEHVGDMPMPIGGTGTMHRVKAGGSFLKLVEYEHEAGPAPTGGIGGALGYRYLTFIVSNIDEIAASCAEAGVVEAVPLTEMMAGLRILIVEDPDGNWVEFVQRDD